mmetsp:Transcript_22353/g.68813  ORF Transcript_22353/g.68813 Transcript_22353/m.68813 type:complete len:151 (+) Transcript_22353:1200-1652(+)
MTDDQCGTCRDWGRIYNSFCNRARRNCEAERGCKGAWCPLGANDALASDAPTASPAPTATPAPSVNATPAFDVDDRLTGFPDGFFDDDTPAPSLPRTPQPSHEPSAPRPEPTASPTLLRPVDISAALSSRGGLAAVVVLLPLALAAVLLS